MEVIAKTKELCRALKESKEFKELKETETILLNDPDALELIKKYQESQKQMLTAHKKGVSPDPELLQTLENYEMELRAGL